MTDLARPVAPDPPLLERRAGQLLDLVLPVFWLGAAATAYSAVLAGAFCGVAWLWRALP